VQKTANGSTKVYVYDIFGLAAEHSSAAVWSRDYIKAGGGALIASENAVGGICTTCYFTTDHLGTTRIITAAANVVAPHDHLPFEEIPASTAGRDSHFGPVNDVTVKFTGRFETRSRAWITSMRAISRQRSDGSMESSPQTLAPRWLTL
jgi:hypothetical protein